MGYVSRFATICTIAYVAFLFPDKPLFLIHNS